jgi:predicted transcriptional regulator
MEVRRRENRSAHGGRGNRPMTGVKEALLELAQQLPDECTWDEVMYRIYVRQKIEAGLRDAEEGRTVSHEEVFEEFSDDNDPLD